MTLTVTTTQTITTDQTPSTGHAIDYGANNIAVTIANDIAVVSRDDNAIFSDFSGSTLINNGSVFSAGGEAVFVSGANVSIINNPGHSLVGVFDGIDLFGDGNTVTNHGNISGLEFAGITLNGLTNHIMLNNNGDIFGREFGIFTESSDDGGIAERGEQPDGARLIVRP